MKKLAMVMVLAEIFCFIGVVDAGEIKLVPYGLDSVAPAYVKSFYNLLKKKVDDIKGNCICYFKSDHFLNLWMRVGDKEPAVGLSIDGILPGEENVIILSVLEKISQDYDLLDMLAGRFIIGVLISIKLEEGMPL